MPSLTSSLFSMNKPRKLHAALLSSPGMGHLVPVTELGKRLVAGDDFDVTIFVLSFKASPAESEIIESSMSPKLFDVIELPLVDISAAIDPKAAAVTKLAVMMREARSAFRTALAAMAARPDVLIVDLFGTEYLPIGAELKIPQYVFIASNAWFLALSLHVPALDKEEKGQYVDQSEPLKIPGCRAVRPEDVVEPMLDRADQQYLEYLRLCGEIPTGDGILVNVWEDLQSQTLGALRNDELWGQVLKVPIYTIGPLIRPVGLANSGTELFGWLDKQPRESVIFVSFGSGGTLSADQLIELAWGLELSQQRFIWVVRRPAAKSSDASYFKMENSHSNDMTSFLPPGFVTRTNNTGLIVPEWAPQVDILNHPSVGAFLSHCGWNSTLESIMSGVPMIGWPLYAEQRLNATTLTEEIGVAVRTKVLPSNKTVGREEIERLVRTVMVEKEGHEMRTRVKQLKSSALEALAKGGSSYESLVKLSNDCKARLRHIEEAE